MDFADVVISGLGVGFGATLMTDAVGVLRQGWAGTNGFYRLVGRWAGSIPRRGLAHDDIRNTAPVQAEAAIGWTAHIALGLLFGIGFVFLFGASDLSAPRIWQGLSFGLVTVLVPWLVFQPLFGWGIAVSKAPNPWPLRLRGLITHGTFGLGLWLSAVVMGMIR